MVSREQLEPSLRHIPGAEWLQFEQLCAHMLAIEFPDIRVSAGANAYRH